MPSIKRACLLKTAGDRVSLQSPLLGQAEVLVDIDQRVVAGQVVAKFFRLGKKFDLVVPSGVSGTVKQIKGEREVIDLAFGENFLWIDRSQSTAIEEVQAKSGDRSIGESILSPMDGMFYSSPSPTDPPFVEVGATVNPGQTIGLIEVMKCFYPLKYQGSEPGKILSIDVENGTPVTSGTRLYSICRLKKTDAT